MQTWNNANSLLTDWLITPEAYSKPRRTSKIEIFAQIIKGWKPLTIFERSSILDVRLGPVSAPRLTVRNSQTSWSGAHNSQINTLADGNLQILGLYFTDTQLTGRILESVTY